MLTLFRPRIRSRHPSHRMLRPEHRQLPLLPFKSIIRLGSFTELRPTSNVGRIEVNTTAAIANSACKLRMKNCFAEIGVKTAQWWRFNDGFVDQSNMEVNVDDLTTLPFPIISKHIRGSRGTGNVKHDDASSLSTWMNGKDLSNYIFERYYNYTREYRLHVSEDGCFYTCRKMLKSDAPASDRWYRNDEHCVWVMEDNELFDKPSNWDQVVEECVKALKAVGLDFGAVDLRIQSSTKKDGVTPRENPEFIVVEINSAPSFGDETLKAYLEELPRILRRKYNSIN